LLRELTEILPATPLEKSRLQTFRQSSARKAVCGKKLEGTFNRRPPRLMRQDSFSLDLCCSHLSTMHPPVPPNSLSIRVPIFCSSSGFQASCFLPLLVASALDDFPPSGLSPTTTRGFIVRASATKSPFFVQNIVLLFHQLYIKPL